MYVVDLVIGLGLSSIPILHVDGTIRKHVGQVGGHGHTVSTYYVDCTIR
jgi:hypothetical protein